MKLLSAIDDAPINAAYLWNSGRAKPIARVSTKVLARARMCLKPTSTVHKKEIRERKIGIHVHVFS